MNQLDVSALYKVAEVELIYRNDVHPDSRPNMSKSEQAYEVLLASWDANKIGFVEQFKIALLDIRNNCLGICEIASGGISMCVADSKLVFASALTAAASRIILAHNHPSGNLQASYEDIQLTNKFVSGGRLLDIKVLDHLIITPHGYYSFADNGLMP